MERMEREWKQKAAEIEAAATTATESTQRLQAEVATLEQQRTKQEQLARAVQKNLRGLVACRDAVTAEIAAAKADLQTVTDAKATLDADYSSVASQLQASGDLKAQLAAETTASEDEMVRVTSATEEAKQKLHDLQADYSTRKTALESELGDLMGKLKIATDALHATEAKEEALRTNLADREQRLNERESAIQRKELLLAGKTPQTAFTRL